MDIRGLLAALAAALALAAPAAAAEPAPRHPASLPGAPAGFEVGAAEALETAARQPDVAEQQRIHGRLSAGIEADDGAWRIAYSDGERERALVLVEGASGEVRESWSGDQVAWPMARGYEGQFGHVLNAPWVWIPLCAVFLLGLLDWRHPWRAAHLDLAVLLGFGVSHVFFNRGEIGISAPLVYPVLVYLLARMTWLGFRGGRALRPSAPTLVLTLAAVALIVFRITVNVADSGVIDVGYAGTIGADRIAHGEPLYGEGEFPGDNRFGDTYGPANYYAYVPFELALPWSGDWDDLPSAHAAAIAFDLATVLALVVFALRLRPGAPGRGLAAVLAFGWLACPYTAFALQSNSNDALVAALVAWALALFARPLARGALVAAAGLVKFAPLALVPLLARGAGESGAGGRRGLAAYAAGLAGAAALLMLHPAIDPGLGVFWERTIANQFDRESPFSIWGQADLGPLKAATAGAVAAFALLLVRWPRNRGIAQVAALAAAVLVATQLVAEHWFYLYVPWFLPALLIALATAMPVPGRRVAGRVGG